MELDPELLQQLVAVFRIELDDLLQVITDSLLRLEQGPSEEEAHTLLDGMFRAAHNIKGAARGVGIETIAELAHQLESLFSVLKRGERRVSPSLIDLSLRALDHMPELMEAFGRQGEPGFDLPALLAELDAAAQPAEASAAAPPAEPPPEPPPPSTADAAAAPRTGPETREPQKREVVRVRTEKLDRLAALGEEFQISKIQFSEHTALLRRLGTLLEELQRPGPELPRADAEAARTALSASNSKLHEVVHLAQQLQHQVRTTSVHLGTLVDGLQSEVRMLRLVPASTLLRPLARTVRDIARELGKEVALEIEGERIELDRAVLQALRDPLNHILRNAIDHGIEAPWARVNAGKPATGQIAITVHSEGDGILIDIRDDGAGIDPARIGAAAVHKGLLSEADLEAMTESRMLDLIYHPGFSSKGEVTRISGRGVGLDVVRANLQAIKGSIDLDSRPGRGTLFRLQVPLTLATDHGLLVRAAGVLYALPATAVERVMEAAREEFVQVEGSTSVVVDGRPVPLRDLAAALGTGSAAPVDEEYLQVVVVRSGWRTVALLVDEAVGEQEMVIKRLHRPLVAVRNVIGGTVTGSGEVVMVLDPGDLLATALERRHGETASTAGEASERPPRLLVVDDSITTRTLERSILENNGYEVRVAVHGKEAWNLMQAERFDLVVTDIEMPLMDGFALAERIKQDPELRRVPVVIVSSLAKEEHRRRGVEVGADAYIVKSQFETQILLDTVRQLL